MTLPAERALPAAPGETPGSPRPRGRGAETRRSYFHPQDAADPEAAHGEAPSSPCRAIPDRSLAAESGARPLRTAHGRTHGADLRPAPEGPGGAQNARPAAHRRSASLFHIFPNFNLFTRIA